MYCCWVHMGQMTMTGALFKRGKGNVGKRGVGSEQRVRWAGGSGGQVGKRGRIGGQC